MSARDADVDYFYGLKACDKHFVDSFLKTINKIYHAFVRVSLGFHN
jgi:hypothetical protein